MSHLYPPNATVVRQQIPREFALHVARADSLTRRAPDYEIPSGMLGVIVPPQRPKPGTTGSLAVELLQLPMHPTVVRYALPNDLVDGLHTFWHRCQTTGLDLPYEVGLELWLQRQMGVNVFASPSVLGVGNSPSGAANLGWYILSRCDHTSVIYILSDLAARLDLVGENSQYARQIAARLSERWPALRSLVAGEPYSHWLLASALRWIVREIAALHTALKLGKATLPELSMEGQLTLGLLFRDRLGSEISADDLVFAAWLVHEDFHGTPEGNAGIQDGIAFASLTALAAARNLIHPLRKLHSWVKIWRILDTHPAGAASNWNGVKPSELREHFAMVVGVSLSAWLEFLMAMSVALYQGIFNGEPALFDLAPNSVSERDFMCHQTLLNHLSIDIDELGQQVIASCSAYTGIGSTDQTTVSPLSDYPLVRLEGSTCVVADLAALIRQAVTQLPIRLVALDSTLGNARGLRGTLGRMFEAYVWDLFQSFSSNHRVMVGSEIDQRLVEGVRPDVLVFNSDICVAAEISLQTIRPRVSAGDLQANLDQLERYARKLEQANATTVRSLQPAGTTLATPVVVPVVVADEPISFSLSHRTAFKEGHPELPDKFVISVQDVEDLAELTHLGASANSSLRAWQEDPNHPGPFAFKIRDLRWLLGPRR